MKIEWESEANDDRVSIYDYIETDRPRAAIHVDDLILEAIESLIQFPGKGRRGRVKGTRELVIPNTRYIVAYRLEAETIFIMRIMDGARRWPRKMTRH